MRLLRSVLLALLLLGISASSALGAMSQNVTVTATPNVGILPAPTGFTVTRITDTEIRLDWTPNPGGVSTLIIAKVGEPPASRTDGYTVYYGNGSTADDTFTDLDIIGGKVYYAAYTESGVGGWSLTPATGETEGVGVTLIALGLIALGLTAVLAFTRNWLWAFPAVIFWAVLGAYAYIESTIPWGDWEYYVFFGAMGMAIFCSIAGFALRRKPSRADDAMIDEGGGDDDIRYIDEGDEVDRSLNNAFYGDEDESGRLRKSRDSDFDGEKPRKHNRKPRYGEFK